MIGNNTLSFPYFHIDQSFLHLNLQPKLQKKNQTLKRYKIEMYVFLQLKTVFLKVLLFNHIMLY